MASHILNDLESDIIVLEDEYTNVPKKPAPTQSSKSKLVAKVNCLNASERQRAFNNTMNLLYTFYTLKSDAFTQESKPSFFTVSESQLLEEIENTPSVEITNDVINMYVSPSCKFAKIIAKYCAFDVAASICKYALKNRTNLKSVNLNFTELVEYFGIEEYTIYWLIESLSQKAYNKDEFISHFLLLPSFAIIALTVTLIYLDQKHEALSIEFNILPSKIELDKEDEQKFNLVVSDFLEQSTNELSLNDSVLNSIDAACNYTRSCMQERSNFTSNMLKHLKEVENTLVHNKRPLIEDTASLIADQSSSETEIQGDENQESQEIRVLMAKSGGNSAKWLENELCHQNLIDETQIKPGDFCFVRMNKLESPVKANFESKCEPNTTLNHTFILRKLIEQVDIDEFIVEHMDSFQDFSDENRRTMRVKKMDISLGHYSQNIRFPEGTRVVALLPEANAKQKLTEMRKKYISGTIAVKPLTQNDFEYLFFSVFFDNNIEAYVGIKDCRLMLAQPMDLGTNLFQPRNAHTLIFHNPKRAEFVRSYLSLYPDWPLIKLKKAKRVLAIKSGHKESALVMEVDRHLALLRFPSNKANNSGRFCVLPDCTNPDHDHVDEWLYRGNNERFPNLPQNSFAYNRSVTISNEDTRHARKGYTDFEMALSVNSQPHLFINPNQTNIKQRSLLQTARKSSKEAKIENPKYQHEMANQNSGAAAEAEIQRRIRLSKQMVYTKLKVPQWDAKFAPHASCSWKCLQILSGKNLFQPSEYKIYSPYMAPLLHGWTREICRCRYTKQKQKKDSLQKKVVYKTPCGIRLCNLKRIAEYLQSTGQDVLTIDMFSFDANIRPHVIAEPESKKSIICDDFSEKAEEIPISVVNALNDTKKPGMGYRKRPILYNLNHSTAETGFCSGCSCTDNCLDPKRCECQQLTIRENKRLAKTCRPGKINYKFRTLLDKHLAGIYECNKSCHCSKACINRVTQNSLKVPLQLFMTAETGWGVRTLVDLPNGTFICTYSGELLTDKMADQEAKAHPAGDTYFADLDLIKCVEMEKQNQGIDYLDDYIDIDYDPDNKTETPREKHLSAKSSYSDEPFEFSTIDDELESENLTQKLHSILEKKQNQDVSTSSEVVHVNPNLIKDKWGDEEFRAYFGENHTFTVNAGRAGNIGRFLNHSCEPNVVIQQSFVDTHDLRLPWLAFFTNEPVKAGEELRWNYNYSVGSVPGKRIDCKCRSANCQGRLL